MAMPEMKAKYKECREAEAQLASLEQKLGNIFCFMTFLGMYHFPIVGDRWPNC